jgi:hypothetical protein
MGIARSEVIVADHVLQRLEAGSASIRTDEWLKPC